MENGFNFTTDKDILKGKLSLNKVVNTNKYEILDENIGIKKYDIILNTFDISNSSLIENDNLEIKKVPYKFKNKTKCDQSIVSDKSKEIENLDNLKIISQKLKKESILIDNFYNKCNNDNKAICNEIHKVEEFSILNNKKSKIENSHCKKCKLNDSLYKTSIMNMKESFNKALSDSKKENSHLLQQLDKYKNNEIYFHSEITSKVNEINMLNLNLQESNNKILVLNSKLDEHKEYKLGLEKYIKIIVQLVSFLKDEGDKIDKLKNEINNIDDVFNLYFEISIEIAKEINKLNESNELKINNNNNIYNHNINNDKTSNKKENFDLLSKDYLIKLERIYKKEKINFFSTESKSNEKDNNFFNLNYNDEKLLRFYKSKDEITKILKDLCNKVFKLNDTLINNIFDIINKL